MLMFTEQSGMSELSKYSYTGLFLQGWLASSLEISKVIKQSTRIRIAMPNFTFRNLKHNLNISVLITSQNLRKFEKS